MVEERSNIHVYVEKIHAYVGTFLHIAEVSIAGSVPSMCSNILFQPLDTIKTRQQISFSSFIDTVKIVYLNDGVIGFWRGIGPTLWRIIPNEELPVKVGLMTSAISRAISCFSVIPITVVKTNFEGLGNAKPYTSTINGISLIYKMKGIRGLYAGTIPTLLRDVPHASIYFGFYTQIKKYIALFNEKYHLKEQRLKLLTVLVAGGISGFLATLLTHPFDVIRTNMQFYHYLHTYPENKNIFEVIKNVIRHDKYLMSGFGPRIIRRSLSTLFMWLMYEQILEMANPTSSHL